ncbi:MAG: SiaB family protein kinase [Bacteroidales bacterium]
MQGWEDFNIDYFYSKLNSGNTLLAYKGSVSSELITNVLEVMDAKLEDLVIEKNTRKKLYNILVESLQNLYHHIDDLPDASNGKFDIHFGIFVVAQKEDHYKVSTGNFIKNEKIKPLKQRLERIKSLSKDELKELYKNILNHQEFTQKGGVGLGLIDMAKRTEGNIEYKFTDYNEKYSFFNLEIYV